MSESETARSADLFNSTDRLLITNVRDKVSPQPALPARAAPLPSRDTLRPLSTSHHPTTRAPHAASRATPPQVELCSRLAHSTSAFAAASASRDRVVGRQAASGGTVGAAREAASHSAYNPRPDAEEHNRLATDLDAHYATAGGYSAGSRLESIDDAQQRQLRRSRAKMNELPLRCCFQCACLPSNPCSSFSFKQSPLRVVLADALVSRHGWHRGAPTPTPTPNPNLVACSTSHCPTKIPMRGAAC